MKLLLCKSCGDVVKFGIRDWRPCVCGNSAARYLSDGLHSEIKGENAVAIGLDNRDVTLACHGGTKIIECWMFSKDEPHVTRLDGEDFSKFKVGGTD